MKSALTAESRVRLAVALAWALGLALRIYTARTLPRPLLGDEPWYVGTAQDLLDGSAGSPAAEAFTRAPGTTWWIAAVFGVAGAGNLVALGIANAVASSLSVPLSAAIGRRSAPDAAWVPAAVAWAVALDPFDFAHAGVVVSEVLCIPVTLAATLLFLRAAEVPSWPRALSAGVAGAALMHVRADCAPLVVAMAGVAAVLAHGVGATWRTAISRLGAAAALAFVLCVPWSLHASRERQRPVFVADPVSHPWFEERRGWCTWLSTLSMRREEWLEAWWLGPAACNPGSLPDGAFADERDAVVFDALAGRARASGGFDPVVDAEFRRLGEARIASGRFRFFVLLPLERTARIWLDPTDSDAPSEARGPPPTFAGRIVRAWRAVWRVLLGAGFLVSIASAFRATARGAIAFVAVARSVSLLFGIPLLAHVALFEGRFVSNVEPLALVALAAGVAGWHRRKDSGRPGPG